MHQSRSILVFLFIILAVPLLLVPSARAGEGYPYAGLELGAAVPTNNNYRAHTFTGISGSPYFGYMFNNYIGAQGDLQISSQPPDNDHRFFDKESQWTTLLSPMVGPRLSIPLGDLLELYGIAEGGYWVGLSGRAPHSAPGFSVGGGLMFNISRDFAVGAFGRWNRTYMSPRPKNLNESCQNPNGCEIQASSENIGQDIRYATAGLSVKWSFKPAPPPPPRAAQAPPPPPPPPPMKKKIVLRSVHFDFNKSNIRKDAEPILDEAAQMLKEEGGVAVICEGHTDSIGSDKYNLALSRRRADSVRNYLVSHGVAASRIRTEGMGESHPVASNETADGRAQNRRVELHVQ